MHAARGAAWHIRPATAADVPHLPAIERDAAQLFRTIGYDFCADGPVRDGDEHLRGLIRGALFVAETEEERLAGFVLLWRVDGRAHVTELSVARAHQGQGIGTALMARAEDWARLQGYREITLTTFRDVPWNAPHYRRLGYAAFTPGPWREGLAEILAQEAGFGFAAKPRIAMRKALRL